APPVPDPPDSGRLAAAPPKPKPPDPSELPPRRAPPPKPSDLRDSVDEDEKMRALKETYRRLITWQPSPEPSNVEWHA
ncbi:hypothetical protein A2U01_0096543, partial [Trifolium medium]|nr:hypothetical protein [Trifolium medium]